MQKFRFGLFAVVGVLLITCVVLWFSSPHLRTRVLTTIDPPKAPEYNIESAKEKIANGTLSSDLPETLLYYTASEWEPSWSLDLIDGELVEFRQLDPVSGADMITDSYKVTRQTPHADGWTILGAGEKGEISFTTTDVSEKGGCTHSASGYTHRDSVTVKSPARDWRGCGGPEI